jgi:hypothetical protein
MCLVIYIAADSELPLVMWNEEKPGFHVTELNQYGETVRKQFSKPFVYELGSHTGCCCGLQYAENEEEKSSAEEDLRRLAEYLTNALKDSRGIELYSCWNGDEEKEVEYRTVMVPSEFVNDSFRFKERQFIEVQDR